MGIFIGIFYHFFNVCNRKYSLPRLWSISAKNTNLSLDTNGLRQRYIQDGGSWILAWIASEPPVKVSSSFCDQFNTASWYAKECYDIFRNFIIVRYAFLCIYNTAEDVGGTQLTRVLSLKEADLFLCLPYSLTMYLSYLHSRTVFQCFFFTFRLCWYLILWKNYIFIVKHYQRIVHEKCAIEALFKRVPSVSGLTSKAWIQLCFVESIINLRRICR